MSTTDPSAERTTGASARPKRPSSVTLVAVLALAVAAYSLSAGALALEEGTDDRLAEGIFNLAFGLGVFVAGVGAFRLKRWAWAVFMTWAVVALTHQILRYLFFGDPNYADMAVTTFVVLALSPLEVQVAFGLRHTAMPSSREPTRNPLDRD